MPSSEYIVAENFDREYGLADLLPASQISALLAPLEGKATAAIVRVDGQTHFGQVLVRQDCVETLLNESNPASEGMMLFSTDTGKVAACPLKHDMEPIGLLLIKAEAQDVDRLLPLVARCLAGAFNQLMYTTYQNKLTAGLHAQVVMESYEQLKQKAAQLERSQAKYRNLAENLEIEVQHKTEEIRETQLLLLQQEKMASVGQLAAGMAHEINNPVGFVISNLNTLKGCFKGMTDLIRGCSRLVDHLKTYPRTNRLDQRARDLITQIDRTGEEIDVDYLFEDGAALISESLEGGQRIQTIVKHLRDFTHPSVSKAETVDINECLETTLAVLKSQTPESVTVSRIFQPLPTITCHLREINQVFYQILQNALLAVGERGRIEIRTGIAGSQAEISVSDDGPGIGAAYQSRIFDPFFTTREVGQGTGLGLHTAYRIVQKYGGAISVRSQPGQGASFRIRLPLKQTPPKNENKNGAH